MLLPTCRDIFLESIWSIDYLGFFLATSTTCFLSFILNIYPKLNFEYGLISLMLQFPYAILMKIMLNADPYEVLPSDRHEGIEGMGLPETRSIKII